jgi:uncharacterized membrane protein YhaH (DUF805 family)
VHWPPAPDGWQFWSSSDSSGLPAPAPGGGTRRSSYQRRWLVLYWFALVCNATFLALALAGRGVVAESVVALALGLIAVAAGALMAQALHRRRCDDVTFDGATQGQRVVGLAWLLLVVIMVVATVVGTGAGARASAGTDAIALVQGLFESAAGTLFGFAALLLVAGDGYTKFRSARGEGLLDGARTGHPDDGGAITR